MSLTSDPIRKTMSLLDENKDNLPEGVYLEMCDNLKKLYLTGDTSRDTYLINLTNEYYSLLEDNEALRHELVEQKRELLRANVSRFERVSRPALIQPRGMLESLLFDTNNPISLQPTNRQSNTDSHNTMEHDSHEIPYSAFGRVSATRIGRR
jgi:hypothetical protein|tara:strand:+ start:2082 stop:2537 length:456 start_codon:yes stop_codon:yes gene_type:complete